VRNGGGLVSVGWELYSQQFLSHGSTLWAFEDRQFMGAYCGFNETMDLVEGAQGHAVLEGIETLSFGQVCFEGGEILLERDGALGGNASSQVLLQDGSFGTGVLNATEVGDGRTVQIGIQPYYYGWSSAVYESGYQQLIRNAVDWTGGDALPGGAGGGGDGGPGTIVKSIPLSLTASFSFPGDLPILSDTEYSEIPQFDQSLGFLTGVNIWHVAEADVTWEFDLGIELPWGPLIFADSSLGPSDVFADNVDDLMQDSEWSDETLRLEMNTESDVAHCDPGDVEQFYEPVEIFSTIGSNTALILEPEWATVNVNGNNVSRVEVEMEYMVEDCEYCEYSGGEFAPLDMSHTVDPCAGMDESCSVPVMDFNCSTIAGIGLCNMQWCSGDSSNCSNAAIHVCHHFDCDDFAWSFDELARRLGWEVWQIAFSSYDKKGCLLRDNVRTGHALNLVKLPSQTPSTAWVPDPGEGTDIWCAIEPQNRTGKIYACWAQHEGTRPRVPEHVVNGALKDAWPNALGGKHQRVWVWDDGLYGSGEWEPPFTQNYSLNRYLVCLPDEDPSQYQVEMSKPYVDKYRCSN
jgi:hypothetical protein